jgi:hypothetical protein
MSQMPNRTPAPTLAPNKVDFLDDFNFSNVPSLPVAQGSDMGPIIGNGLENMRMPEVSNGSNELNITNFMVDASSD